MSEITNNKEYRQQELKKIIKDLHAGVPLEEVKERHYRSAFSNVGGTRRYSRAVETGGQIP